MNITRDFAKAFRSRSLAGPRTKWDQEKRQMWRERGPNPDREFRKWASASPGEFAVVAPELQAIWMEGMRQVGTVPMTEEQLELLTGQWLKTKAVREATPEDLAFHRVGSREELAAQLAGERTYMVKLVESEVLHNPTAAFTVLDDEDAAGDLVQ